uniref:KASH domain-containing protein n=1 Tax=Trichogramma kaykai TaxID=54128 RepID=A0ABD2X2Q3_9HYME
MKMSFSLSSLQPSSKYLERAEHAKSKMEKPFNSLNKKRKEPVQEECAKYWSGTEDSKDDFWAAIQTNYDYIMDTNLIDTCKETNGELTWDEGDVSTMSWGLKEVSCQFSELYSWLRVLQELVYSKEENILDKSLRAAHTEELRRKAYRRRLFNEQAEKLIARAPSLKEEVYWRVDHLNAKWNLVEQIMAPVQRSDELDQQDVTADFEHEVKCLRKWLREMEDRLQPLNFHVNWSRTDVEEKAIEHMVLQRDIEAHGRIVSSVVKLGERVAAAETKAIQEKRNRCDEERQQQQQRDRQQQPLRVASSLERRWHLLFLRALEWQCHIEALAQRVRSKYSSSRSSSDSDDEEPVPKQPRLSRRVSGHVGPSSGSSSETNSRNELVRRRTRRQLKARSSPRPVLETAASTEAASSDSEASSKNRFIDDGGYYFEDNIDELCLVNENQELGKSCNNPNTTKDIANDVNNSIKKNSLGLFGDQGAEADIEEAGFSEEEVDRQKQQPIQSNMTPSLDPVPVANNDPADEVDSVIKSESNDMITSNDSPKRRRTEPDTQDGLFNTSNRKSKNCATFYFKHMDTDSEADSNAVSEDDNQQVLQPSADDSSEEEWTYTSGKVGDVHQHMEDNTKSNGNDGDNADEINGKLESSDDFNRVKRPTDNEANKNSDDECGNDKDSIQRLIREVEKLVREEGKEMSSRVPSLIFNENKCGQLSQQNHKQKYERIKEWLALNSVRCREDTCTSQYCQLTVSESLDSCDASGEYTTGESDIDRQSVTSEEDVQSSVSTSRRVHCGVSQFNSEELLDNATDELAAAASPCKPVETSTPKVVMRQKTGNRANEPRPWSVSCIQQIKTATSFEIQDLSQHSISETALHKLLPGGMTSKNASLTASGSRAPLNNSTSTLLEETILGPDAHHTKNNTLRRRKNRHRKKNANRKSESGSDVLTTHNTRSENSDDVSSGNNNPSIIRSLRKSIGGRQNRSSRALVSKSDSFSGYNVENEPQAETIQTNSNPSMKFGFLYTAASVSSESDIDEGDKTATACVRMARNERLHATCEDTVLTIKKKRATQYGVEADSDLEKNSLGANSLGEQAWDNYQEKYMSEAYSEATDVETARRLLDFGDDYRNFLDSQSDCASSLGVHNEDSDSDMEFKRLTQNSQTQLLISEARYGTLADSGFTELTRVCRENIKCLKAISETSNISRHNAKHSKQIRGLMERWDSLSLRAEETQKINAIHREMAAMKLEFCAAYERFTSYKVVLKEPQLIEDQINKINGELANLRDSKAAMLALNVSTHRLITDLGQKTSPTLTALKDGVADLYRLWDEAFQKGNQQLCKLQVVHQFEARLAELQCALRRDKDTLAVLDAALQAGATMEVATSVRDVARLLSEKHEARDENGVTLDSPLTPTLENIESVNVKQISFSDASHTTCSPFEGGSLSDSGISDSGSEQELSERERRLAALRRLTRSLESQFQPESCDDVLGELWRRVEEAEAELRNLQKQCRELIVRTAASVESKKSSKVADTEKLLVPSKRDKSMWIDTICTNDKACVANFPLNEFLGMDDPDNDPDEPRSWVWRVLRAALPFQLALVVLFCAACLLEPHCCEAGNTLNLSLTPQLRYLHGPPPV